MAKNPVKTFTLGELEEASKKAQIEMAENASILPQIEGPGSPDFESKDPQKFAGDDTYTYGKQEDSPLNGAYESGVDSAVYVSNDPAFSKLQDQINTSTKEAVYGLAKDKKDEEISDAFKSFRF